MIKMTVIRGVISFFLACGAEMCAPLANNDLLDRRAAHRAGLSFTVVHTKIILKATAAIHPIKTGAVVFNTAQQHSLNGGMKSFGYELPADVPESELLALIDQLNRDPNVHGIQILSNGRVKTRVRR